MSETPDFHLTIDFLDDVEQAGRPFTADDIDRMMAWYASCGIRRIYWIHYHDVLLTHAIAGSEQSALELAAAAARRHGMSFWSQLRVFETGLAMTYMPYSLPLGDRPSLEMLQGSSCLLSPFVMDHPEWRIARRPAAQMTKPRGDQVARIDLIKEDDAPTRIRAEDLELWTSAINGNFRRYTGPRRFDERVEQRLEGARRVLSLSDLELASDQRYLLVRCSRRDEAPDFRQASDAIMELRDANGDLLPATPDRGLYTNKQQRRMIRLIAYEVYGDWQALDEHLPEIRPNPDLDPTRLSFTFNSGFDGPRMALDGTPGTLSWHDGIAFRALGQDDYLPGSLHPAHPEVRAYWLDWVQAAIDAGADGATVRILNHSSWQQDKENFGFNAPALALYEERYGQTAPADVDFQRLRQINGDCFTEFLREAAERLHAHGCELQAHVCSLLGDAAKLATGLNHYPWQFAFDWERWIDEQVVDSILFKPPAASYGRGGAPDAGEMAFFERVARKTAAAELPLVFESRLPVSPTEDAFEPDVVGRNISLAWAHPAVQAINLYEGASIYWLSDDGAGFAGLERMRDLLQAFQTGDRV